MWHGYAVTSSTLLADPPSNETIDVFYIKRSGEREIVYNVYKCTETESEVGITIPLSKVQKRVAESTRVSRETLCRVLKGGENEENCVAMAFSTPYKLRIKVYTKSTRGD